MNFTAYHSERIDQSIHLPLSRIALAGLFAVALAPASGLAQKTGGFMVSQVLGSEPLEFLNSLERTRPQAVSAEVRARVLRSLRREGEVKELTESQRRKLSSLVPVLSAHGREAAYEVKVISVPQAYVGLYERTVLLLSISGVDLLTAGELQALVAHEIGHEYVWQQSESARTRNAYGPLRQLELYCDAVAIATLHKIGADPAALSSGVRGLSFYNRSRFGIALNELAYPTLASRSAFAKSMIESVKAAADAGR